MTYSGRLPWRHERLDGRNPGGTCTSASFAIQFPKKRYRHGGRRGTDRGHQKIFEVTRLLIMKTTSKTIDPAGQVPNDSHDHAPHSHGHQDHDDHDHDGHNHDHGTGTAEYLRLGLMG